MKNTIVCLVFAIMLPRFLGANQGNESATVVQSRSLVDTLNIDLDDTVNVGFSPGDIMMEVFRIGGNTAAGDFLGQ